MNKKQNTIQRIFQLPREEIKIERRQTLKQPDFTVSPQCPSFKLTTNISPCQDLLIRFQILHGIELELSDSLSLNHLDTLQPVSSVQNSPTSSIKTCEQTLLLKERLCVFEHSVIAKKVQNNEKDEIKLRSSFRSIENGVEVTTIIIAGNEEIQVFYRIQVIASIRDKRLEQTFCCLVEETQKIEEGPKQQEMHTEIPEIDYEPEFSTQESHSKTSEFKKPLPVKKSISKVGKKADKKNVVKNFVKAFRSYLVSWGQQSEIQGFLKGHASLSSIRNQYCSFEQQQKYNNLLIKSLLKHQQFGPLFLFFLKNRALEWLKSSGVVDKQSHQEVLEGWIKAGDDEKELEGIVCLKSRISK